MRSFTANNKFPKITSMLTMNGKLLHIQFDFEIEI